MYCEDMEGSGDGLIRNMIPALTRGTEETQETSVRITDLWDIV
jgi:hypothetical protein